MRTTLVLALVLTACVHASAADIIECSATRGTNTAHWAWREINGKRCWYRGEPGRSKSLLRWAMSPRSSAETGRPEPDQLPPSSLIESRADPDVVEPPPTEEPKWQATMEDQLLAFTCCWPEPLMAERSVEKKLTPPSLKIQDHVADIPKATPPVQPLWPLMFLPVTVIAVSILLAKWRLT
jgi:hypothetical protein